jgi:hypothetical protein
MIVRFTKMQMKITVNRDHPRLYYTSTSGIQSVKKNMCKVQTYTQSSLKFSRWFLCLSLKGVFSPWNIDTAMFSNNTN